MRPFTKSLYVLFFVAGMIVQAFAQAGPAPQPAEQATPAPGEQSQGQPSDAEKTPDVLKSELTVTARRVEEEAQDVPIPLTVVDGRLLLGGADGTVRALRPDGSEDWRLQLWRPQARPWARAST